MLTGLLITFLVLAAIATVGGMVVTKRRRELAGGSGLRALPGSGGDKLLERTIRDLRAGDVLTYEGKDFVVEGVVQYDEDGHRWSAGRMVDGADRRWLVAGLERAGSLVVRVMKEDDSLDVEGYPPEALVVGEVRYVMDKRGTATARMSGDTGFGPPADDGLERAERCRWWLYDTPGDDALIVEQWGKDFRVLRGSKVNPGLIDLIPGS